MGKRFLVRREACPSCGTGVVLVTYEQVINGNGNVAHEAPIRIAGCRSPGCPNLWIDSRAKSVEGSGASGSESSTA